MRTSLFPWRLLMVIHLVSVHLVRPEGVFTLQMNDLYSIDFSMEMLSQFYSCLCDNQDQSCSVLLERDLAFTYITRMVSVSRFPSFANRSQQQVYSKNFVCSIPTSFNDDQMIGCIRLKHTENLCDNLELCESFRLIRGDPCDAGFAGVYWLYPGRIRQKIDNRFVGFSQCSQECENSSSVSKSVIGANPVLRTTKITHATTEPSKSTTPFSAKSDAYSYYNANARQTTTALRTARTSLRNPSRGVKEEGKIVIMITVIIGIVLVILGIIIAGVIVCRKRRKYQSKLKSSPLSVISDPNTTLQVNLTLGRQGGVPASLSEADGSSLADFHPETPPMNSPRDRLIANRKAAPDARGNLGVVNNGFQLDINDNTFISYADPDRGKDGANMGRITANVMCDDNAATMKWDAVSEISSMFDNCFSVLSNPSDGLVYAKAGSGPKDIFYDNYDSSFQVDTAAAANSLASGQSGHQPHLHPAAVALYATVGEKAPKTANAYSRLNETVRVLTNPYNKLTYSRDGTSVAKTRLKPYSITHLYSPSSVTIVRDEFYSNEMISAQFLGDSVQKSGYVNFKYGTLFENVPASLASLTDRTPVGGFLLPGGFQPATSLARPKHIYFELEKDCDVSQRSSSSTDEDNRS
ncbi:hypothetical protein Btru_055621 [Bulinus truncatus]|nr:hypothetical protein Btru_055621 [Bulinus truncatus]